MPNFSVKNISFPLQLLVCLFITVAASSQTQHEMKKIFTRANSVYLYEDYDLANQLFLLVDTPDNMNIKYKIGVCYLNIPGEKEKSIPYLEDAVKSASYDSKTDSFKEKRAPLDVYFYLAKAYMINNEPEKALNTFLTLKSITSATKWGMKNIEYIDQEIQSCKNTIQFKMNPVVFSRKQIGEDFSHGAINDMPAVSFDGNTIVYTERRGIVNAIFFSTKKAGAWQPPREITSEIKAGEDCSSCSLNSDGTELFLYKTRDFDGDIYSSVYESGVWSPIKALNKNINTKFFESHASISYNNRKLYFTSNRPGGIGNLDIYVSEKDGTGDWGPAVNIGPVINTPFNEDTPFMTQNDSLLYFCSEGHNSMGGYDNFKSLRSHSGWNTPSNLGFPINSADDDKFYQPVNNGLNAYYSMPTDYKKKEIFYLTIGIADTSLSADTTLKKYEAIDLKGIPSISAVDTNMLIKNMNVNDIDDVTINDSDILYYTVQVIALYNPVDVSYFKYVSDIKVMYNDTDKFYRYTTGRFSTIPEAEALKSELLKKGYPSDIFVKKVSKK
jgi:hypothetical protein